ncbi:hypothetical protein ACWN8V_06940 [Vagococcus elongatus]|uniref:Uncharacterized protein n=1 Tax=Vagococcus elongatus TaxID=180344 RepID=A0A430AW35_9ENTE|nr:hypothetical protein [Vagococcus elongatus]RSU12270.1 hypothetical protein CBF29_06630 [Vagococcus elongatus]
MNETLVVRQSYHGTGSYEGYVWKVYDRNNNFIGELGSFSSDVNVDSVCKLNNKLYVVTDVCDSKIQEEVHDEVIYFKLKRWEYSPDFDLNFK